MVKHLANLPTFSLLYHLPIFSSENPVYHFIQSTTLHDPCNVTESSSQNIGVLPLSLLRTGQNHPMLVELKIGETYNDHLVSYDNLMNNDLQKVSTVQYFIDWSDGQFCMAMERQWLFFSSDEMAI